MEHLNHMGGISYFPENPLVELELVMYSSFLHEPTYYSPQKKEQSILCHDDEVKNYVLFPEHLSKSRQRIFYEAAQKAYDCDFKATLELAKRARQEFLMRKSPCELLAIGASHRKRSDFNMENPLFFRKIVQDVCMIPPDMVSILNSWKSLHGSKSKFPTILKKAFCEILVNLKPYHLNKYRHPCIDMVRLCHPPGTPLLKELMETGKIDVEEKDKKWETLMAEHGCWKKTMDELQWQMPHMAALRNICGFARNIRKDELIEKYCQMLEGGVLTGKQFPFRYIMAQRAVKGSSNFFMNKKTGMKIYKKNIRNVHVAMIEKSLENCIQSSIQNHPKLSGDTFVLSDNSGSAWGSFSSEYGECTVADIGNISALITALSCTGRGVIGFFGDTLLEYTVDKNLSFLENYKNINHLVGHEGKNVGGCTENGIWLFFKRAMKEPHKYRYDNLFCYSDMQAGQGKLYGCDPEMDPEWVWNPDGNVNQYRSYIHVPKLLEHYRRSIHPKINVFTIQTGGYNDSILPLSTYRGAMFSSWTGRETIYAEKLIKLWNQIDLVQNPITKT